MNQTWNFSAGPAVLPQEVLERARHELLDFDGRGMSVMEISHRSKEFLDILHRCEARLRRLMGIPSNYHVLFAQGGAWTQFAMVPMNLMKRGLAQYIDTGSWAAKAAEEAAKYGKVEIVASSKSDKYANIPALPAGWLNPGADYVHLTTNNTIYGTTWHQIPDTGDVPLVADMSSNILSQPYRIEDFGLIYAGAQKNIGPSGLTIVIVREDLIGDVAAYVPTMMQYRTFAENESMFNTPPTFGIYLADLVFEWLENLGGVAAIHAENVAKAKLLYDFLDQSQAFQAVVDAPHRSLMNVVFRMENEAKEAEFLAKAEAARLYFLKGHRSVGGMRASLYNAMPIEGVAALVNLMKEWE
ncbi:MAG: 3-phosphoserine/phosphohydroxythreonine transaminase [Bacteroidia bacterium]|nr:3-phosphoserine/phosphohydroxythreonine transaminase [Bacteroidia bacterium]